jgi:UDP-N-acetylglucosamine 1-carboxyvinyltransferase
MPLTPQSPQAQLARLISEKRKRLRITQIELAQLVGTSQTAIARIESGLGNPTVNLISRISTALILDLTIYFRPARYATIKRHKK